MVPWPERGPFEYRPVAFGVPELDALLHGGLERGTVALISGPSGTGKSTIAAQFVKEAAGRGERSVFFTFDESAESFRHRGSAVGLPVREMEARGSLVIKEIEPLALSVDELSQLVRVEVEERGTQHVVLDSVDGYRLSVRGADLVAPMHALARYLQQRGVTAVLVEEVASLAGEMRATEHGFSYLADTLLFLRYFQLRTAGDRVELRKLIGCLKKRLGSFERTVREIEVTRYGLRVGAPMAGLREVLVGGAEWTAPRDA